MKKTARIIIRNIQAGRPYTWWDEENNCQYYTKRGWRDAVRKRRLEKKSEVLV